MRFTETPLAGAFLVDPEPMQDERGSFSRTYCDDEYAAKGLHTEWPQENVSYNVAAHTLRGMHFNARPYSEEKTVQCTAGAIYDVIIDLRPDSETQFQWFGVALTSSSRTVLYVPKGFAHGFMTLMPDSEIRYRMGRKYQPAAASGIRWNDPMIDVTWPATPAALNDRDAGYEDLAGRLEEFS